ncbi:DUF447 domain-containing protein [Halobacteriales archaeon QS_3_64_16]|nr:MAG: DUF447 domain-containing protein [Halobacteriales archaeon QS_3_64_16]
MTDADRDPESTDIDGGEADGSVGWPVCLRGVTESVVATLGPNDRWNCAALGLLANDENENEEDGNGDGATAEPGPPRVTARTWGRTRTWRNFREEGEGYVQFVRDPVVFTEAALSIHEERSPVLDAAAAWVRVDVERIDAGESGGTQWVKWALHPRERQVLERRVPTIDRGHGAVIEATIAASRLDVPAYDTEELCDRLAYSERVVERCGGPREREAFSRLVETVGRQW